MTKNVVMISFHDPAGCMYHFSQALNEYTDYNCRAIRMADLFPYEFEYDLDTRNPEHDKIIADIMADADILHFTTCSKGTYGGMMYRGKTDSVMIPLIEFPSARCGLQMLPKWRPFLKDKEIVVHFHGDMDMRADPKPFLRYLNAHSYKVVVSTPDLLKVLPDATWIPNIIPIDEPVYVGDNIPDDFVRIYSTCRNYDFKGSEEFAYSVIALAHEYHNVIVKYIIYREHNEALRTRQDGDIFFDQMGLNAYGVTAIEALSQGQAVLVGLDAHFNKVFHKRFPTKSPFISVNSREDIYNTLVELVENPYYLKQVQTYARRFMERYMHPKLMIRDLVRLYES